MITARDPIPASLDSTIVDVLRWRALNQPDRIAFTFLYGDKTEEINLNYRELDWKARVLAAKLNSLGLERERALLLLPSGLDYIIALFGCLYAGVIAVPGFPLHLSRLGRGEPWFRAVMADAQPKAAFASPETVSKVGLQSHLETGLSQLQWLSIQPAPEAEPAWRMPPLTGETLAFLQYTSGSTSAPRGVMVAHGNIMHNQEAIRKAYSQDHDSTVVSWLPLHHDMGLIGSVLQPVYAGSRSVLMAPGQFLQNPVSWLQAISRYRGKSSSAPNFAYGLCSLRITPQAKEGLDLSSWEIAVSGAEPVQYETLKRFAAAFAPCGFRAEAFRPSYGLAESTLLVTGERGPELPIAKRFSARWLERNILKEAEDEEGSRLIVGCGRALPGHEVCVVDQATLEKLPDNSMGEIWVRGSSVTRGYWNQPEESARTFQAYLQSGEGPFLRTGDIGFVSGGQLFISGRLKDLIILRGKNLYPQDIELTMQNSHPKLLRDCGAACAIQANGEEALLLVNEVNRNGDFDFETVIASIREAVALSHGVQPYAVILVRKGTVPKTTSGKIRRSACRDAFLAGKLEPLASSILSDALASDLPGEEWVTRSLLLQTEPELRQELLCAHLRNHLTKVLKLVPGQAAANTSLLALGLDSIRAVELSHLLESSLGVQLPLSNYFEGCTLEDLAGKCLDQLDPRPSQATTAVDELQERDEIPFPLSFGQRGLWTLYQAAPEGSAYNLAQSVSTGAELDVDALRSAFQSMLARHPVLRTVFVSQGGEPAQLVRRLQSLAIEDHFYYQELAEEDANLVRQRLESEAQRPFMLEKQPPVRLMVFHLPQGNCILMLALHHIIADLWSIEILLRDLILHDSLDRSTQPHRGLKIVPDYIDFVRWQARLVQSPAGEQDWLYWSNQLSGELPVLQLPTDHPRPPVQSFRGASESLRLASGLYSQLKIIAHKHEATVFMVLLAALNVLLHRLSGQIDLCIGVPMSGRTRPEFSEVVGCFVNTVVLRSRYDSSRTFLAHLSQARSTVLHALEHQDYPFPLLVEKLHPNRSAGTTLVFQVMFAWQKSRTAEGDALAALSLGHGGTSLNLHGLQVDPLALENHASQFDSTLMLTEVEDRLVGQWKYSTDLFDQSTICRILHHFSTVLEAVADNPEARVSELPLLSAAEREQMLYEWNPSGFSVPSKNFIHALFAEHAGSGRAEPALVVGEQQLTYEQLNARANQLARYLRKLGVGAESLVGICLNRSVDSIVAILGTWKAGGAYMPLDPREPVNRIASSIRRSAIHVMIVHEHLLAYLKDPLPPTVVPELDADVIAEECTDNLDIHLDEENLAYVISTSGSTGEPKGVMIEHRSLSNLLSGLRHAIYDQYGGRRLRIGLNAPFTFDSSVKQLITFALGHTLFLVEEDIRRNGQALLEYAQRYGLDVLDCTPSQAELLVEAGLGKAPNATALLLGGEPIPDKLWQVLARSGPGEFYNLYGPTECTVDATLARLKAHAKPLLGRPLDCTKVYLLDECLEPVPIGVPGEIFLAGASVGRGYLKNPAATAEKFVPDPFSPEGGARMYRTGDLGRYMPDGTIEFVGRRDRQVKVRGFRIEPAEIEAVLRKHPGVEDAAVVAGSANDGHKQLWAYVVSSKSVSVVEVRRFLAQELPEYMVPSMVTQVPAIPTNANGKRDYRSLPVPELADLGPRENYIAPRSKLEEYLAALWTEILKVKPIGIHDNFFVLGGDSMQATRLITRIREQYPAQTSLLPVFLQRPTIAALGQAVAAANLNSACDPSKH